MQHQALILELKDDVQIHGASVMQLKDKLAKKGLNETEAEAALKETAELIRQEMYAHAKKQKTNKTYAIVTFIAIILIGVLPTILGYYEIIFTIVAALLGCFVALIGFKSNAVPAALSAAIGIVSFPFVVLWYVAESLYLNMELSMYIIPAIISLGLALVSYFILKFLFNKING
jgi:hypothetical protein